MLEVSGNQLTIKNDWISDHNDDIISAFSYSLRILKLKKVFGKVLEKEKLDKQKVLEKEKLDKKVFMK